MGEKNKKNKKNKKNITSKDIILLLIIDTSKWVKAFQIILNILLWNVSKQPIIPFLFSGPRDQDPKGPTFGQM